MLLCLITHCKDMSRRYSRNLFEFQYTDKNDINVKDSVFGEVCCFHVKVTFPASPIYPTRKLPNFDSLDRLLKCDHSLDSCLVVLPCSLKLFVF